MSDTHHDCCDTKSQVDEHDTKKHNVSCESSTRDVLYSDKDTDHHNNLVSNNQEIEDKESDDKSDRTQSRTSFEDDHVSKSRYLV